MARRRKYNLENQDEPGLDISSLIDVSFLLLIYFLITSSLQKKETDLTLMLPSSVPSAQSDPIDPVSIRIDPDGAVYYDDPVVEEASDPAKPNNLPELLSRLTEYRELATAAGDTPIVIVDANDAGKTQRLVDVINVLSDPNVKISTITMTGFNDGS
ncbi:MAG: biopolymer transporter ExbD [Verrucomicrobiota bacterium]